MTRQSYNYNSLRVSTCERCVICKGYWPGTRGYVIYSPRGVPEGVARGHATRGIYHISPRDRSITCLFIYFFFRLVRIPNRNKDLK